VIAWMIHRWHGRETGHHTRLARVSTSFGAGLHFVRRGSPDPALFGASFPTPPSFGVGLPTPPCGVMLQQPAFHFVRRGSPDPAVRRHATTTPSRNLLGETQTMTDTISRRGVLKTLVAGSAAAAAWPRTVKAAQEGPATPLKGRVHHSVCRWCYRKIPLEDLCQAAKKIGLESIELLGPDDWPTLRKHGLTCAMANGAGMGITKGFNRPQYHDDLVDDYAALVPKVAQAGLKNLICFSGNRKGLDDEAGLENCARGLKRLMPLCEKQRVTLVMELLNSKVNHKDYQCDHTTWASSCASGWVRSGSSCCTTFTTCRSWKAT